VASVSEKCSSVALQTDKVHRKQHIQNMMMNEITGLRVDESICAWLSREP
jgi:hypothetical protein